MNFDALTAFDIHTHAEEPCCGPRDDGYDEFQAGMAGPVCRPLDHCGTACPAINFPLENYVSGV